MIKHSISVILTFCAFFLLTGMTNTSISTVPEPFRGFDNDSKHTIRYDDLTALLKTVVVDVGRSNREAARPYPAKTGTRMVARFNRLTATEGNRFYYETFVGNEKARQFVRGVRDSLVSVPDEVPLENFSRDEQLAYWLNLYNVTLLDEIIAVYPKRDLEKVLKGDQSILSKKLITVAGVPLSLDDIQFRILMQNYDHNPLVIYGLYQGIIGGPNIRRSAYKGYDVYRALEHNAIEFINSNRGTYSRDRDAFRISSFYDRNRAFFPDFDADLSRHLLQYLEGSERSDLQAASILKPDINDWTVTDLGGTQPRVAGSLADNNAALIDSVWGSVPFDAQFFADFKFVSGAVGSASVAAKGTPYSPVEPVLLEQLHVINEKREQTKALNATVRLEELGEVPVEPKAEEDPQKDD